MALYTGVTGYIKSGTTKLAHMSNWSLELTKEMLEVISFGNTYKEKVPSIKDWSASSDGTTDFASTSGQKDLVDAFESGTKLTFGFGLDDYTFFEGDGYIESLKVENAADGKADISISIAGSNGVVLTLPSA
ncbi:MAG TPA: hypothetical protein PLG34_13150 [Spirochaetota bacterium]|nr:hypothetical protein [Spirochaetota bacterium]